VPPCFGPAPPFIRRARQPERLADQTDVTSVDVLRDAEMLKLR
jgi:hypothetical protein